MTQEELDALPETGVVVWSDRLIDGKKVRVPVMGPTGAMWTKPDEPCSVQGSDGTVWMLGWIKGVRYKRRSSFRE